MEVAESSEEAPLLRSSNGAQNEEKLKLSDRETESSLWTEDGSIDIYGNRAQIAKSGGWKACCFILANECCERLAYYGISTNLVTYMTTVLKQGNAAAAASVNNWVGTCYITPFVGAFIADAYWGRYWTIACFSTIYFVGMTLLALTAAIPALSPSDCSGCVATAGQLSVFYIALYLTALGTGGIKPCVSTFGADQFDKNNAIEYRRMGSFFNWFYFSINIGALISSSVLVYIQDNFSWAWGFGIPAAAMGIAVCSFLLGSPLYRRQKVGGSPLTRMLQVCVSAFRKRKETLPTDPCKLHETEESFMAGGGKLEHSNTMLCLDKAAIIMEDGVSSNPWQLCTVTQVEELKSILNLLPIWATSIFFWAVYVQMSTLFVEQGSTMDTSMGPSFNIPPASLSIFDILSVLVWVPLYDFCVIPLARIFTRHDQGFTAIQRMGIGLVISIFSMVAAALVEIRRLDIARDEGLVEDTSVSVPMSIFWQIPQYFLIGASEVFTSIGQLEFFYDQSPSSTRSLCSALALASTALGSYLSSLILRIVTSLTTKGGKPGWIPDNLNIGHIDYFFWLLAGLCLANLGLYIICAYSYTHKKGMTKENKVAIGP